MKMKEFSELERRIFSVGLLAILFAFAAPGPASAITDSQIRAQCTSGIAHCSYDNVRTASRPYLSSVERVSPITRNCSTTAAVYTKGWEQTTSTVDEFGITITGGYDDAVVATVATTYRRSWSSTKSESGSLQITAQPKEEVWIERQVPVQDILGDLTTHYESPIDGHYQWTLFGQKVTGPPVESTDMQPVLFVNSASIDCPS